jgi:endonuclease/exonuclease/phosphatase family metal-dependent hydrolase
VLVQTCKRFALSAVATATVSILAAASAAAQTTLTLTESSSATLRGGTYASTNLSSGAIVETRASSDASYVRRALFKFDTNTTIPAGTPIASAYLTFTVAGGDAETRKLAAYHVTNSYDQAKVSWTHRKSTTRWTRAGGDLGAKQGVQSISAVKGSKVTYDVTSLVRAIVRGDFGSSRYTRLVLIDEGSATKTSYKAIHSDKAAVVSMRPTLVITTGTAAPAPQPLPPPAPQPDPQPEPPAPRTPSTLRALVWNIHHGGFGTDGKYDTNRVADWIVKMQPDVVFLIEVEKFTSWGNQDQPAIYRQLLAAKTGKTWYAHFAQEYGNWTSNGKGNLLLSTVPFTSTDYYELVHNGDRSIAQAVIHWNGVPITLMATHLDPDSQALRLTQATEVTTWAAAQPENRIIGGDMNAWPDQTSIAHFNKTYNDSWAVAAKALTATAFAGNTGETKKGRIDYIFYSKGSTNLFVKSAQVYDTRDANGVMPSDHRPLVTVFEVR